MQKQQTFASSTKNKLSGQYTKSNNLPQDEFSSDGSLPPISQFGAAKGLERIYAEEGKKNIMPNIIGQVLPSIIRPSILSDKNERLVNQYKSIIGSSGANDFVLHYGTYKQNAKAVASYINTLSQQSVQMALQASKTPGELRALQKLSPLLHKMQALQHSEEDAINIASVFERFQQLVGQGFSIQRASDEAYEKLNKIFLVAQNRSDEEFLANAPDMLQALINPKHIAKFLTVETVGIVDSILNFPYALYNLGSGVDRLSIVQNYIQDKLGITRKDLENIDANPLLRLSHGLPLVLAGTALFFGPAYAFVTSLRSFMYTALFNLVLAKPLDEIRKLLGMSDATYDAIMFGTFVAFMKTNASKRAKNNTPIWDIATVEDASKNSFESTNYSEGEGPTKPKTPNEPGGPKPQTDGGFNEPTNESTTNIQSENVQQSEGVKPEIISFNEPKNEYNVDADNPYKNPIFNKEKFYNAEPVSSRHYVDANHADLEGKPLDAHINNPENSISNKDLFKRGAKGIKDIMMQQKIDDIPKAQIQLNNLALEVEKSGSIKNTLPKNDVVANSYANYFDSVYENSLEPESIVDLSINDEANTWQYEQYWEAGGSTSEMARNYKEGMDRFVGKHLVNEIARDRFPYSKDSQGNPVSQDLYNAQYNEFSSASDQVKERVAGNRAANFINTINDKTSLNYLEYNAHKDTLVNKINLGEDTKFIESHKDFYRSKFEEIRDKTYGQSKTLHSIFGDNTVKQGKRWITLFDTPEVIADLTDNPETGYVADGLLRYGDGVMTPLEVLINMRSSLQKTLNMKVSFTSAERNVYTANMQLLDRIIGESLDVMGEYKEFKGIKESKAKGDTLYREIYKDLEQAGLSKDKLLNIAENPKTEHFDLFANNSRAIDSIITKHNLYGMDSALDRLAMIEPVSTSLALADNAFKALLTLDGLYKAKVIDRGSLLFNNNNAIRFFESQWYRENSTKLLGSELNVIKTFKDIAYRRESAKQSALNKVRAKNSGFGKFVEDKVRKKLGMPDNKISIKDTEGQSFKISEVTDKQSLINKAKYRPLLYALIINGLIKKG